MTKRKIIIIGAVIVVAVLLAAAIAAAGGMVGYLVAKRSPTLRSPSRLYLRERHPFPVPFFLPAPEIKREFVMQPLGAQVTRVEEGSPAEEAEIKVGDIITAVGGVEIDEEHPLRDLILEHEPGEEMTLTLTRRGESREIQVTLGETTEEEGETVPYLGIHYWSIKRRYFQTGRFDRSHLPQPKLSLLADSALPS